MHYEKRHFFGIVMYHKNRHFCRIFIDIIIKLNRVSLTGDESRSDLEG
jgi:hypothetical protein